MSASRDKSSSTAPTRAWYLARQCLGSMPLTEWGEDFSIKDLGTLSRMEESEPYVVVSHTRQGTCFLLTPSPEASSAAHAARTFIATVQEEGETNARPSSLLSPRENRLRETIAKSINRLYDLADEEWFEDGVQSNLGAGLEALLREYPAQTMSELSSLLTQGVVKQAALIETLKVLGRVETPETRDPRLFAILDFLKHASLLVRDAALVSLCLLKDRRAIPYLEQVVSREVEPFFRNELKEVIIQLQQ